jgi:hypothetical protein
MKLLCKNGVQGVKFCVETTLAATGSGKTAVSYVEEGRDLADETAWDAATVKVVGPLKVTQSTAVRRLFTGLPQRMGATLCGLGVGCP